MSPEIWVPGAPGPSLEDFVERLLKSIARLVAERGTTEATVVVELVDGMRFAVASILPEPGYGFLTLRPHPDEEDDLPTEVITPVGAIKRIEVGAAEGPRPRFGFTPPAA